MTERLLHYLWQFKMYNATGLETTEGTKLLIIHPGQYNTDQGPDFLNARIVVGDETWAGHIELHIMSSNWSAHHHSSDPNYNNVILHVVWINDLHKKLPFPTLELQSRISNLLLNRYDELMQSPLFIPCQQHIKDVESIIVTSWKERLLIERLQHRTKEIEAVLKRTNNHWDDTLWQLLARNFGIRVNSDSFEKIAETIPFTILVRHKNQLIQLEALLFGQAGLLDKNFTEAYPKLLKKEYQFLSKKYKLKKVHFPLFFLRMRPANFPTVRLAQLAAFIHKSTGFFAAIRDAADLTEVKQQLDVQANDYWHYHYVLDEPSAFGIKKTGSEMIGNIIINTIVPVLYAYGYHLNNEEMKTKATGWLEQMKPETNSITKGFSALGVEIRNAGESQALIQMKNEYCNYKKCLQCHIGNSLLRTKNLSADHQL